MPVLLAIDGVLQWTGSALDTVDAQCRAFIEQAIHPHATARKVISSSWRLMAIREQIVSLIAPDIACRIVGRTPWLDRRPGTTCLGEPQAFVASLRAERPWVAIDDAALRHATDLAETPPALTEGPAGLDGAARRLRQLLGGPTREP